MFKATIQVDISLQGVFQSPRCRGSGVHMLNTNCLCNQRTDEKKNPISPPRDILQQTVCINRSHGCSAAGFYEAIFLFNNTTHTHSLEQVTVYRSEFNPGRPQGETTPCSRDQNKIYYFCPEILPSLHFGHAERNLTSAISPHFIGIISPHSQDINLFN